MDNDPVLSAKRKTILIVLRFARKRNDGAKIPRLRSE